MYNKNSDPEVADSTFSGNSATNYGGGMRNISSNPTVTNCTFSKNQGYCGGGGDVQPGQQSRGDQLHIFGKYRLQRRRRDVQRAQQPQGDQLHLLERHGKYGKEIYNYKSSNPTVTYCVVRGGDTADGNLNTDPFLGPLQDNGGFTRTYAILKSSSSAKDTGTSKGIDLDQRGIPRDDKPDIGAYEYRPDLKILTVDTEGSGNVTCTPEGTAFGTRKNQWYYDANNNTSVTLEASPNSSWGFRRVGRRRFGNG